MVFSCVRCVSRIRVGALRPQPSAPAIDVAPEEPTRRMAREQHVHATYLRPVLDHAVTRMGRLRTEAVLRRLGTTEACLRGPGQWTSLGLAEQLFDALIEESENPFFVEEAFAIVSAGRYMWLLRPLLRLWGSPLDAYEQMAAAIPRVNRAGVLAIEQHGARRVVMVYTSELEANVQLCRGRLHQLSQVPTLFGRGPAEVLHPECLHRGDPRCRYEIRWPPRGSWWRRFAAWWLTPPA